MCSVHQCTTRSSRPPPDSPSLRKDLHRGVGSHVPPRSALLQAGTDDDDGLDSSLSILADFSSAFTMKQNIGSSSTGRHRLEDCLAPFWLGFSASFWHCRLVSYIFPFWTWVSTVVTIALLLGIDAVKYRWVTWGVHRNYTLGQTQDGLPWRKTIYQSLGLGGFFARHVAVRRRLLTGP